MRKFLIVAAGAAALLTLPASVGAQELGVGIHAGPGGAGIVVRDRDDDRRWRHREWRRHRAECRVITERHRRGDGSVVVRRIRDCD